MIGSFEVRIGLFGTTVSAQQYGQAARFPTIASRMYNDLWQREHLNLIVVFTPSKLRPGRRWILLNQ